MLHRAVLLALALAGLAPFAAAQQEPPPTTEAPPTTSEAPPATTEEPPKKEEKGPNLQTPAHFSPAQKAQLEAAVEVWEAAYESYQKEGAAAARPKVDRAIDALREAKKLDPTCAIPDHYLGIAYQLTGEFNLAIERLKEAVRRNPRFHEAMVELGDAYQWAEKLDDAMRTYDQAIATKPDYAHAYKMRCYLRVRRERYPEALVDVRKGLELEPASAEFKAIETQLALVTEGPPWPQKFTCETRSYVVWTNVDQAFADEIGKHAELIRKLYTQIFPRPPKARRKFPIVVFASREEYHRNGGPRGAGGHYSPVFKQLFFFKYADKKDTLNVLYHEGFHQFLDSILETKAPQWFDEGLGDFFGFSEHFKKDGEEGMRIKTNPWRLPLVKQMIQAGRTVDFEKLMTMSQQEMYGPDAGLHYAQAWSMIYFLAQADNGAYFDYLKDYFQALRRGKDIKAAFKDAFGRADMGAMQARWRDFISGLP
jgi:tetratricopeptide (TPR) repeat protein